MKLEKLANFQSELTFLVKWSPDLHNGKSYSNKTAYVYQNNLWGPSQ